MVIHRDCTLVRIGEQKDALVVIHNFKSDQNNEIKIEIPNGLCYTIRDTFAHKPVEVELKDNILTIKDLEDMQAVAFYLESV